MAMEYGSATADLLGVAHEYKDWPKKMNSRDEYSMDLWNNRVGIKYGMEAESSEELGKLIKKAIDNGELILDVNTVPEERMITPEDYQRVGKEFSLNGEEFQIFKGDVANQLADSGMIGTDATFVDSEGNPASMLHRDIIVFTDENGETYTIIKYGTKTPAKDGLMYDLVDLSKQVVNGAEVTIDFIYGRIEEAGKILIDQLTNPATLDSIYAGIISDIILGENDPEKIAKNQNYYLERESLLT